MGFVAALRHTLRPRRVRTPAVVFDLSWVDEFISNVRPYVFVRREDNLLIKRPNQAQKLNPNGAALLKSLLDGRSISQDEVHPVAETQLRDGVSRFGLPFRLDLDGDHLATRHACCRGKSDGRDPAGATDLEDSSRTKARR